MGCSSRGENVSIYSSRSVSHSIFKNQVSLSIASVYGRQLPPQESIGVKLLPGSRPGTGWAYMVRREPYEEYVLSRADDGDVCAPAYTLYVEN